MVQRYRGAVVSQKKKGLDENIAVSDIICAFFVSIFLKGFEMGK